MKKTRSLGDTHPPTRPFDAPYGGNSLTGSQCGSFPLAGTNALQRRADPQIWSGSVPWPVFLCSVFVG